jgi:hypothetical protein
MGRHDGCVPPLSPSHSKLARSMPVKDGLRVEVGDRSPNMQRRPGPTPVRIARSWSVFLCGPFLDPSLHGRAVVNTVQHFNRPDRQWILSGNLPSGRWHSGVFRATGNPSVLCSHC